MPEPDARQRPTAGPTLGALLRHPVAYVRDIPYPIRLLTVGMVINYAGNYVIIFLALILALRHVPPERIGLAMVATGTCAIAGSALGGFLVNRIGSRRTIVAANAGSGLCTLLLIAHLPYLLMVTDLCLISLLNRSFVPACATLVGRLSKPSERLQRFAMLQLSLNIGISVGPPLATYLLTHSLDSLFLIDAVTSVGLAAAALRLPAESELRAAAEATPEHVAGQQGRRLRNDYWFLLVCLGIALTTTAYNQQAGPLPLTIRADHYNLEVLGVLFSANCVVVVLFQLPLTFFTRKLPPWLPLAAGAFTSCTAYAILLAGVSVPLLAVTAALWTLGEMLFNPLTPTVAMMMSTPDTHGSYQGAVSMSRAAGQALGPALGVLAFSRDRSLPWACCAVLAVLVPLLFFASAKGMRARLPAEPPLARQPSS